MPSGLTVALTERKLDSMGVEMMGGWLRVFGDVGVLLDPKLAAGIDYQKGRYQGVLRSGRRCRELGSGAAHQLVERKWLEVPWARCLDVGTSGGAVPRYGN